MATPELDERLRQRVIRDNKYTKAMAGNEADDA